MLKKITIVGRDIDAWLTALMLKISVASKDNPVVVELIELPSTLGPQDVVTALPSQRGLNQLLGISDFDVVSACNGLPTLGQRFSQWSERQSSYLLPYDSVGVDLNDVSFIHYWIRGRQAGLDVPLEEFSLGAAAAKRNRSLVLSEAASAFSNASYGFNLSALEYVKLVAKKALSAGVQHTVSDVEQVKVDNGKISGITLTGGERVEADLFIDASGQQRILSSALSENGFKSWQHWFACDKQVVASVAPLQPLPAFSEHIGFDGGWVGLYPLAKRTALKLNASPQVDVASIPELIQKKTGLVMRDGKVLEKACGYLDQPWLGNCVSVGASAAGLDALDSPESHFLHTSIVYLISLLPVDGDFQDEAAVYNRRLALVRDNIRDFQLAHYFLRQQSPSETTLALTDLPDRLVNKLETFKAIGTVPMQESEVFLEESWAMLFAANGLLPQSYSKLVDNMAEPDQIQSIQQILKFVSEESSQMPTMDTFVEMNTRSSFTGSLF